MDNDSLRYAQLNGMDAAMQQLDEQEGILSAEHMLVTHEGSPSNQPNQVRGTLVKP